MSLMPPALPPRRPREEPAGLTTPERFGRYVLVDRVGSGGMAEVFRAVTFGWQGFQRIIVVKRIRRELSESPDFLRMFFDEAKISALLHHPNIVQVYDFGQVQGHYFLAMEYLEGKDVASIMKALRAAKRVLDPSLAAFVGREIALGLHYAHTLRSTDDQAFDIVHRDVNPANIMLLRTGGVKLLDFGIAKASDAAGKSQTQRAIVKGKLSYLSPEQASCEKLDGRSDLFSWGATMWEMLTGLRLFGGKTDFDRLTAVKHATVPPPSSRRPDIPVALDRIVLRALERDVGRRYQSAEALAIDLENFLRTSPPDHDGVTGLLGELFGEDSGKAIVIPALDHLLAEASHTEEHDPGDDTLRSDAAGRFEGTAESTLPVDPSNPESLSMVEIPADEPAPRRGAVAWAAGVALLVGALGAASWSLRSARPVVPAIVQPAALGTPNANGEAAGGGIPGRRAAGGQAMVKIEVDSEPAGASVSGSQGSLGKTPLTVILPASTESEQLLFEKPGFVPTTYEVRPQSAGIVFVELKPARRNP
jgi:serine/threonine protein kinase